METQSDTAIKVMSNLSAEAAVAVQNEKSHRIQQMAKSFGVATSQMSHLKGVLTPVLPYEFRNLDLQPDHLDTLMESSKKIKMLAATETIAESSEAQKKTTWSTRRNYDFGTSGYQAPKGILQKYT